MLPDVIVGRRRSILSLRYPLLLQVHAMRQTHLVKGFLREFAMGAVALALSIVSAAGTDATGDATRVALVIGNTDPDRDFPNEIDDARAVANALRRLNFQVNLVEDGPYNDLWQALLDFGDRAIGADAAVVFFAGLGVELNGMNYLVPAGAQFSTQQDVPVEALPLDVALAFVQRASGLGLVILDTCFRDPFAVEPLRTCSTTTGRGLVEAAQHDTTILVAYTTREPISTLERTATGHSPFTQALLDRIETPGLDTRLMLEQVRDDVIVATGHQQEPVIHGALGAGPLYFIPPVAIGAVGQGSPERTQGNQSVVNLELTPAEVRELQALLIRQGLDPGGVDGVVGQRTLASVADVQLRLGLAVNGIPTRDLLGRLRNERPTTADAYAPAAGTDPYTVYGWNAYSWCAERFTGLYQIGARDQKALVCGWTGTWFDFFAEYNETSTEIAAQAALARCYQRFSTCVVFAKGLELSSWAIARAAGYSVFIAQAR
jgi:hypothetical protein